MSTVKNNIKYKKGSYKDRFAKLANLNLIVFHTGDLANLWQITNTNTLHTTLKRYAKEGLIIRIYRGLYSLRPISQIDPTFLGAKALHKYAYVSTETILFQAGIINHSISQITLVSSSSRKFSIGENNYFVRKLADRFLYQDIGIFEDDGIKKATPERAVADLLYFNPKVHLDNEKMIDWKKVKQLQRQIGYPLTFERYKTKMG